MKRSILEVLLLLMILLVTAGCNGYNLQEVEEILISKDDVSLTVKGETVFVYDSDDCQLAYNDGRNQFRAMRDDMSDYFSLTSHQQLVHLGQEFTADLDYTVSGRVRTEKNLKFTVEKIDNSANLLWLWSSSKKIGVVVKML